MSVIIEFIKSFAINNPKRGRGWPVFKDSSATQCPSLDFTGILPSSLTLIDIDDGDGKALISHKLGELKAISTSSTCQNSVQRAALDSRL